LETRSFMASLRRSSVTNLSAMAAAAMGLALAVGAGMWRLISGHAAAGDLAAEVLLVAREQGIWR
jgi:hypothetical protein